MSAIIAVALTVLAVLYFMITTLADLYPLNNVRDSTSNEKQTEVAVNAPIMLVPAVLLIIAVATGLGGFGYAAGVMEMLIAAGGLALWWPPYLVGRTVPWATAGTGVTWPELHARTYAKTIILLPELGDRPRPNLEHMILHALVLAAAVTSFIAAVSI